jgi:polysaccharide biosynthesis transport protein
MENKQQQFPNLPPRRLTVPVVRPLPELIPVDGGIKPYLAEAADRPESAAGLLDYWRLLVHHKVAVLGASLGGLLLGILIGVPMRPVFRASTTLEVLKANDDFMNTRPTQSAVPGTDSENISEEETQATLLQSDPLLARVCAKLNPNPTPPAHYATSGWRGRFHMMESVKPSAREKLLAKAVKSLKVTNAPRTRVLSIDVDSADSQLALDFTNILVQEFIKQNIDARWASTQQTGDWLSHEINDTRTKLKNSEDALQAYARSSNLFFINTDNDKQTNIGIGTEKLRELQQQLSVATADRIAKQSVFELARNSPPEALADVLNDPSLQSLSSRLDDATRQVASLRAVYNSGYTKLQQAEAEVIPLRDAFTKRRAALLQRIETDYQSSARREKLLSAAYDAQTREVSGEDERAVQYNILKREVESNQQLYDTMLQQMKQTSIAMALHASNVRVVDGAYLQDQPVFPNFKLNAALGFLGGIICSVGFIFVRESTDRTLRQPGDVKLWASLPELGVIPRLQYPTSRSTWALVTKGGAALKYGKSNQSPVLNQRPDLLTLADGWNKPTSMVEAFHSALTSILLAGENHGTGRVLVFTSVGPADGKTSVVSNIAIAAAKSGRKVLLVDADLRRPRIHDVFGLRRFGGITEILSSEAVSTHWPALVQPTKFPGLSVITAGKSRPTSTNSFYSLEFSSLLGVWGGEYDLVLIDTPPATHITDARVIGAMADGVVLVARAEQTTRDSLIALQERFMEDRIHLLGCILNDWDPSRSEHVYPFYSAEEETFA